MLAEGGEQRSRQNHIPEKAGLGNQDSLLTSLRGGERHSDVIGKLELRSEDKTPIADQTLKVSLRAGRSTPCLREQRLLRRLRLLATTCSSPLLFCSSKILSHSPYVSGSASSISMTGMSSLIG